MPSAIEFYSVQSDFTTPGRHAALFAALPDDLPSLFNIVQVLMTYDVMTHAFHGFGLGERQNEIHLRRVEDMVSRLLELVPDELSERRAPENRLAGRCCHYARLLVAMLRAKGLPARVRGGFATYLNRDSYEDHWICEYWNGGRWAMADPQMDGDWIDQLGFEGDPLDLQPAQFLNAGIVWQGIRRGEIDPGKVGISFGSLYGDWFAGGSVIRDLASLNKVELLPWDIWGAQPQINASVSLEQEELFDRLASLTAEVPDGIAPIIDAYESDERVRAPGKVFNALTMREENLPSAA